MATMESIAQALGLSKATVSKALSGAEDVGEKTRLTVLKKAAELGYSKPRRRAVLGTLAVFVINMEYEKPDDFGYDIIAGFRKAAEPVGYRVKVVPLDLKTQRECGYDDYMADHGFCGGLLLGLDLLCPWLQEFAESSVPAVLYDNHVGGNANVTHVGVDNDEGMEMAVKYLKSLHHIRIGYLSGTLNSYVYRQRLEAFFRALRENGLTADRELMGHADHTSECLSKHLPRLLERGCTAIVCSHDMLAHSVMVHCAERGLRIPEDLSILGYDDIPLCRYTVPPLTTIRQDRTALGKSSFYALSSQLARVHLSTHLLHPALIERASCAAPQRKE